MNQITNGIALLLALFGFCLPAVAGLRQQTEIQLTPEQDAILKQRFKQVHIVHIDLHALYLLASSRKTDIPVLLSDGVQQWDMLLEENEIRSANYTCELTTDSGRIQLPAAPCGTYKGYEKTDDASWVRMNIREHSFSALIYARNKTYYVELLNRILKGADENWAVIYTAEDVVPSETSCGGGEMTDLVRQDVQRIKPVLEQQRGTTPDMSLQPQLLQALPVGATGLSTNYQAMLSTQGANCRKLEIATESDNENYNLCCGYEVNFSDILDNLNYVDGLLFPQFGIKIHVVYQHQWATTDPYSGEDLCNGDVASNRLWEFRNYWNNNYFQAIPRDLAIMYSGIDFNGSVAGCARTGSISDTGFAQNVLKQYMVIQAQQWIGPFPATYLSGTFTELVTHEIGHILGSGHDDSFTNIMNSSLNLIPTTVWASSSINSINTHLGDFNTKQRLGIRYLINPWTTSYDGAFSGGEVFIQKQVNNGTGVKSFEGVDHVTVGSGSTLIPSGSGKINLKTGPCNNTGK